MLDDKPREHLTFDDVLLLPAYSEVLPAEVDVRTRLTRNLVLHIPGPHIQPGPGGLATLGFHAV